MKKLVPIKGDASIRKFYRKKNNHNTSIVVFAKKEKIGLGLGLFIGKTLLEKNFAFLQFRNSETRSGAEVIIKWKNKDLFNI